MRSEKNGADFLDVRMRDGEGLHHLKIDRNERTFQDHGGVPRLLPIATIPCFNRPVDRHPRSHVYLSSDTIRAGGGI